MKRDHGLFGGTAEVRIKMLTGGGRKNVFTEEAVPGERGERASPGQRGLKRRGLAKRQVAGADTVLAIGKTGRGRGRTNNRMCWNVGPRVEERTKRRNSRKTRIVCSQKIK